MQKFAFFLLLLRLVVLPHPLTFFKIKVYLASASFMPGYLRCLFAAMLWLPGYLGCSDALAYAGFSDALAAIYLSSGTLVPPMPLFRL